MPAGSPCQGLSQGVHRTGWALRCLPVDGVSGVRRRDRIKTAPAPGQSTPKRRYGWFHDRAQVERLEDRVLLSAEPMVQATRVDTDQPLSSANVLLEAMARDAAVRTVADVLASATRIDLTKGASQDARLSSDPSDPRLLALNASLQNLVIDLGAADDRVVLLQQTDGRLRLVSEDASSGGLYDLVFARPSTTLAIRGSGGTDQVVLGSADLGQASLFVEAESIQLDRGDLLTTGGSVVLRAQAEWSTIEDETVAQAAEIEIDGSVDIGGDLVLDAWVATNVVLA